MEQKQENQSPQTIPSLVRRNNNLLFRQLNQYCKQNGVEEITAMHGWILRYLYRNRERDIFQRDIERDFSITRSTVTNILQLMEKKGYITRQSVPQDARLKRIVLTENGINLHERMVRSFNQTDDYVQNLLEPDENRELIRLLQKLHDSLQQGLQD